jgi:SAM-dependent methyltransferase
MIYDVVILRMTETWYRSVFAKLDNGSIILDVGVGTGGALLRCADLIKEKDLKVVGIDIDSAYVEAGKAAVEEAGLGDRISIDVVDVYAGKDRVIELAKQFGAKENEHGQFVDAVYFSGSFSLLPDPVKALQLVSKYVNDNEDEKGHIYITQTYQRRTPFFLPYTKPLMKYVTTIDFGNLVREEEVLETFKESGLKVLEHSVIPGSVDNAMQAAYLSVLE